MNGAQVLLIGLAALALCIAFYAAERADEQAKREVDAIAAKAHGSSDWSWPDRLDN